MSFRDIVVDACPRSDIHRTLERAHEMAVEFGAKLTVVSYAWPRTSIVGDVLAGSAFTVQEQTPVMEDALGTTRSAFDSVFAATPLEVEWCSGILEPAAALRDHLLAADLLITSASEDKACVSPDAAELALRSGTPVLRLGRNLAACRFPKVVVAWKDCSQARRAVHDALPILKRADSVTIVGVGDEVSIDRLEAVDEHLRRHEVTTGHLHVPRSQGDICADLLTQAQREGAGLIVAGVYSRGPFAERVLGGVTREMLRSTETSWFMAH